jgi:hypothetical protein
MFNTIRSKWNSGEEGKVQTLVFFTSVFFGLITLFFIITWLASSKCVLMLVIAFLAPFAYLGAAYEFYHSVFVEDKEDENEDEDFYNVR